MQPSVRLIRCTIPLVTGLVAAASSQKRVSRCEEAGAPSDAEPPILRRVFSSTKNFPGDAPHCSFSSSSSSLLSAPHRRDTLGRNFVADAVELALPSVVRIEVATFDAEGYGSGVCMDPSLYGLPPDRGVLILTNAHVILTPDEFNQARGDWRQRAIVIEGQDGQQTTASILVLDVASDLALLHVDSSSTTPVIQPSAMVATSSTRHGEFVVALGAPLELEQSVTVGIVSNPNRRVGPEHRYIQTDASIHVGNSGGPLVNLDGQVVGIMTMKVAEGISYAIPIGDAIETLRDLLRHGGSTERRTSVDAGAGTIASIVEPLAPRPLLVGKMEPPPKTDRKDRTQTH